MAGASARDIKRRIRSVQNIGKVTRAMEAVSASKMRRAQAATLRSRAYAAKAAEVMAHLKAQPDAVTVLHPLLQERDEGRPAVVLITPDRGLTGGLVLNMIRFAVRGAKDAVGPEVKWVALGKKGRDFLARHADLVAEFTPVPDNPSVLDISPLVTLVIDGFLGAEFSSVHLAYADFVSVSKQNPVLVPLLPVPIPADLPPAKSDFDFEPSPEAVLGALLPRLVELTVYQALLEAQASEHSARMVAMRNATDAAGELVGDLTLSYNKARQAAITAEILDIAGGAEALRQTLAAE
jgi:F-type H+-transporting ATPase subunit gamma